MVPIHQLLSRIRWDPEFGKGRFEIGYWDNLEDRILRVPFREIRFEPGNDFAFFLEAEDGELQTIPYHRVREVRRDGAIIWKREG